MGVHLEESKIQHILEEAEESLRVHTNEQGQTVFDMSAHIHRYQTIGVENLPADAVNRSRRRARVYNTAEPHRLKGEPLAVRRRGHTCITTRRAARGEGVA